MAALTWTAVLISAVYQAPPVGAESASAVNINPARSRYSGGDTLTLLWDPVSVGYENIVYLQLMVVTETSQHSTCDYRRLVATRNDTGGPALSEEIPNTGEFILNIPNLEWSSSHHFVMEISSDNPADCVTSHFALSAPFELAYSDTRWVVPAPGTMTEVDLDSTTPRVNWAFEGLTWPEVQWWQLRWIYRCPNPDNCPIDHVAGIQGSTGLPWPNDWKLNYRERAHSAYAYHWDIPSDLRLRHAGTGAIIPGVYLNDSRFELQMQLRACSNEPGAAGEYWSCQITCIADANADGDCGEEDQHYLDSGRIVLMNSTVILASISSTGITSTSPTTTDTTSTSPTTTGTTSTMTTTQFGGGIAIDPLNAGDFPWWIPVAVVIGCLLLIGLNICRRKQMSLKQNNSVPKTTIELESFGGPRRYSIGSSDNFTISTPSQAQTHVDFSDATYAECGELNRCGAAKNTVYAPLADGTVYSECPSAPRGNRLLNNAYCEPSRGLATRNAAYATPDGICAESHNAEVLQKSKSLAVYIDMAHESSCGYGNEATYGVASSANDEDSYISIEGPDGNVFEVQRGNSAVIPGPHYFDPSNGDIYVSNSLLTNVIPVEKLQHEPVYADVVYGTKDKCYTAVRQISFIPDDAEIYKAIEKDVGELVRVVSNDTVMGDS